MTPPQILLIDNTVDPESWGSRDIRDSIFSSLPGIITVRRGLENDLPKNQTLFTHIIISGSRASCLIQNDATAALDRFLLDTALKKLPVLGICYGHQALIRAFGGVQSLSKSQTPEFGWTKISKSPAKSLLLEGIPSEFYSFSSHWEEISVLPDNFINLASSLNCAHQAFSHSHLPIFGVQFHPERTLHEGNKVIQKWKIKKEVPVILNKNKGASLYSIQLAKTIFTNFLRI